MGQTNPIVGIADSKHPDKSTTLLLGTLQEMKIISIIT
jgi:hypothetical protein